MTWGLGSDFLLSGFKSQLKHLPALHLFSHLLKQQYQEDLLHRLLGGLNEITEME